MGLRQGLPMHTKWLIEVLPTLFVVEKQKPLSADRSHGSPTTWPWKLLIPHPKRTSSSIQVPPNFLVILIFQSPVFDPLSNLNET